MRFENTKARAPRPVDSASERHFCSSRATSLARSRPSRARLSLLKLGAAAAASTPMITSTTISSISVKPDVARGVDRARITLSHIGGWGAAVEDDGKAAQKARFRATVVVGPAEGGPAWKRELVTAVPTAVVTRPAPIRLPPMALRRRLSLHVLPVAVAAWQSGKVTSNATPAAIDTRPPIAAASGGKSDGGAGGGAGFSATGGAAGASPSVENRRATIL